MLSKRDAIEVEGATACDLTAHVGTFVESLAAGGYAAKTQRVERRIVEVFLGWAREARLAAAEIDESCVEGADPSGRRYAATAAKPSA
jgi:ABC-type sulfate transport system substrate-binding protein